MIIAVDHGNSAIKTENFVFPSALSQHTVAPPMAKELLEYGGHYWSLSGDRIPYNRNKTTDEQFFILTLFAIAKELKQSNQLLPMNMVDLAIGLPPEHWAAQREVFARYFKRPDMTQCVYNNNPLSIGISHVFVYPQAYAAVIGNGKEVKQYPRVYIADLCGYTVDVLELRNGVPNDKVWRSLEMGIITMCNNIAAMVNTKHDMQIHEDHIMAVLNGQETGLGDEIVSLIKSEVKAHASLILDKLRELQIDMRANPVYFVGGGAILLEPFIRENPKVLKPQFVLDVNANAKGFRKLAEAQLRRAAGSGGQAYENQ